MRTTSTKNTPAWSVTAAALLSFMAFSLGNGPSPALPVLALGLLAVYGVPFRVERATQAAWLARLGLYGLAFLLNAGHEPHLQDTLVTAAGMNFLGPIFAAELVLRAWHRPTDTRPMLLLSGLLLLFGCATGDERVGVYLVPPYFFCVVLASRADRPRIHEHGRGAPLAARAIVVALAFALGGVAQWGFRVYKSEIVAWGSGALGDHLHLASAAQTSGIVKDPTLGPTFGSPGSSARILRIVGSLPDPHLHGMAYDTYVHGAWLPTLGGRRLEAVTPAALGASALGPRVQITRFVEDDGMVSAPLGAAGIVLGADADASWSPGLGGPVRVGTLGTLTYEAILGPGDNHQGPLCAPPTPVERALCLAVPSETDPGVRTLAQRIAGRLPTASQRVEAVRNYLLLSNAYSLRTDPGKGDPVSNFLLQHKSAHCEFFASSAAILLRCVGVPTRYAIGYYAHESDGAGATVVRGQDAHAWAESWIDGAGWTVVEATPGSGRPDHAAKTPFWWKFRDRWQDLALLLEAGVAHLTRPRLLLLVLGLCAFLLICSVFRLTWERHQPSGKSLTYSAPPDLAELAARFDSWLARRGVPCPPERPWDEHLARIIIEGPSRSRTAFCSGGSRGIHSGIQPCPFQRHR